MEQESWYEKITHIGWFSSWQLRWAKTMIDYGKLYKAELINNEEEQIDRGKALEYIKDWQDQRLRCYFCGTNKSVKYSVELIDDNKHLKVCVCNRCALIYGKDQNRLRGEADESI